MGITYIDNISPSIANANNVADTLIKQKANDVQQALQQAELLRSMGMNKAAEEMIQKATNTGLAGSLYNIFNPSEEWTLKNPFVKPLQTTALLPDAAKTYSGDAMQGQILAELKDLYSTDENGNKTSLNNNDYNRNQRVLGLQLAGANASDALTGTQSSGNKKLDAATNATIDNVVNPIFKDQLGEWKSESADYNKLQAPIDKENAAREEYKQKVNAYNSSLPSAYLEGNEADQQQQLIDSTMKSIKNGGGIDAYAKYITAHNVIDKHYGHKTEPLDARLFGLVPSGKGGKLKNYTTINPNDGKPYQFQVEEGTNVNNKKVLDKVSKDLGFVVLPGHFSPTGDNNNQYSNPNMNDPKNQLAQKDLEDRYKFEAEQAKDNSKGWFTSLDSDKTRAEKVATANKQLSPNSTFEYDKDWNLVPKKSGTASNGYKSLYTK